jgi:hypothetical protein
MAARLIKATVVGSGTAVTLAKVSRLNLASDMAEAEDSNAKE